MQVLTVTALTLAVAIEVGMVAILAVSIREIIHFRTEAKQKKSSKSSGTMFTSVAKRVLQLF